MPQHSHTLAHPIAESEHFIVLNEYHRPLNLQEPASAYNNHQSEKNLEELLIKDLQTLGYEYLPTLNQPEDLLRNVRTQLERLNEVAFTDVEWARFVVEYLDKPGTAVIEQIARVQQNHVKDFKFDDGEVKNIYLVDKVNVRRNRLQVIHQFQQTGLAANRYDVTILVNGLPMVQVELKKRGVSIREAFNQVHRYSKESFNAEQSLFKYLQIFVISNGTDTRYFANTTQRNKNSFDFSMNWAQADNTPIKDLTDFTATFFQQNTLLQVLLRYVVLDCDQNLLIMRPYQIAATERILWKVRSAFEAKAKCGPDTGGYIWHTTGSGKTLTSFKAARLATELPFVDKVFFVVDRKDLDFQTMREYKRFQEDSVNGSADTRALLENLRKDDSRIVVTTLQKLNILLKRESQLPIYKRHCVFIFDECHRSQFGEAQANLQKRFSHYYQFGFTGTPIMAENAPQDGTTTASVFGTCLHSYKITDAIRDEKVLKFKVDYNTVRPRAKKKLESPEKRDNHECAAREAVERETDIVKLNSVEAQRALMQPQRIAGIVAYILNNYKTKTHRNDLGAAGFNAMLAVSSVKAAQLYYSELKRQMAERGDQLKVATIFSYAPNEEQEGQTAQGAQGEIADETFNAEQMDASSKKFLAEAVKDYNAMFDTSFTIDGDNFQNYYRDLCRRLKVRHPKELNERVDLVIVVGMLLTGFDAPGMNTLFVDKNLRYHGLIQAFSRTNRIYNATKSFGNIVCFRDLEEATKKALALFGQNEQCDPIQLVIERGYKDFMEGYEDERGHWHKGYVEVVTTLQTEFPDAAHIEGEKEKKAFAKLYGQYLRLENVLRNFDEFTQLRELHEQVRHKDAAAMADFQADYQLTDAQVATMLDTPVMATRQAQDYSSTYHNVREWIKREREHKKAEQLTTDWDDVVFEVDLLSAREINLDYILGLIYDVHQTTDKKADVVEEVRRVIRASLGQRAKETLIVEFIDTTDLDAIAHREDIIPAFYDFAIRRRDEEREGLIAGAGLRPDLARHYLDFSLRRGYASAQGTDFSELFPTKISPLQRHLAKERDAVFEALSAFVEKYRGI